MSFWEIIYDLLIGPLELFFQVVYALAYRVLGNPGLSIIFLSLAMNFLVLPLYRQADKMQNEEREVEAKLQPWIKKIKKTFKGDEQYMMLKTYYRQNNYKPTDSLKGSISLLLEVPFFIAAYRFLSNLKLLNGVSFGPISDLGTPDALITAFGITINLLPILMTVINFVSGAIYTRGFPLKSKIQLYGVAIIFLVFLYKSPAGLVFYWTLNNLFSLLKNIFYKIKNPKLVFNSLLAIIGFVLLCYVLFVNPIESVKKQLFVVAFLIALMMPLLFGIVTKNKKYSLNDLISFDDVSFYLGCIFISVFIGLYVPSSVVGSSPAEFVDFNNYVNPMFYILATLLLSLGAFVIWFSIFYKLGGDKFKAIMGCLVFAGTGVVLTNYFFFGKELGTLSSTLTFAVLPNITIKEKIVNVFVVLLVSILFALIWKYKISFVKVLYSSALIVIVILSVINLSNINNGVKSTVSNYENYAKDVATLSLSKSGKNVVIIMLDRAISSYIPYIFSENEDLKEKYSGFTYYPNTVSFGCVTNIASPAIFGGYEYTPEAINKRYNEKLADKHNEALKVLPTMFSRESYEVTICDPPYAGYSLVPNLSIYENIANVNSYITIGMFDPASIGITKNKVDDIFRNLFCYSIFRVSPSCIQNILYDYGMYNDADAIAVVEDNGEENAASLTSQTCVGMTKAFGYDSGFLANYSVLCNLIEMTKITSNENGSLLLLENETTHNPTLLQEPEYKPTAIVDNDKSSLTKTNNEGVSIEMDTAWSLMHFQCNMASFIRIGEWLDYLKDNGIYDNTKIIIVSDHSSWGLNTTAYVEVGGDSIDRNLYNPVLMVKDYDSQVFKTDYTFMTTADVPYLAIKNVLKNDENPFTGNSISLNNVNKSEVHIFTSNAYDINENCGNTFISGKWVKVQDNLFDSKNWDAYDYKGK